ncbi:hypothetical protein [uncultured Thiodictyon sp.]|uniref:hypothetical protein n=1 Tax=uncultured Thiodictyon sp. TaxID=1846217 RepID=UPI0025DF8DBB|nr:hypothetical protein [uncultured Thiodictyon sp.]
MLLCLARGLTAGDFPPLVAEGELIDDPEGVIAGIMPWAEVRALAFSPDGRVLASAAGNTVYLWDPTTGAAVRTLTGHGNWVTAVAFSPDGRLLASVSRHGTVRLTDRKSGVSKLILAGGRDGAWVACRPAEGRCWRHDDDGSLLLRKGANGLLTPVLPPAGAEPARLEFYAVGTPDPALATGDGRSTEVTVRIVNQGSVPADWLRIRQARDLGDPLLYTPPPVHPRLDPGQSVDLTGRVSYLAAWTDPQAYTGRLRLQLDHAHGTAGSVEVPIRATAPQILVAAGPELVPGKTPALSVRLHNGGGQDLEQTEVRAHLTGLDADLPRQSQPLVKAGTDLPLSFALPKGAKVDEDSRLTLVVDGRSYPPHDWTFPDLPIRLPTPPWQLYAGLAALVLTLSALLWSLREYTHPLTRRLAADPAALAGLGLAQLERARTLLRRTGRLGTVLAAGGVQGRWLDRAIQFRGESPQRQARWLAERLGAGWQRLEGLGDGGAMAQFELALGDGFPLNLSACRVAFPPADWPAQDVLTLLGNGGDRPCLVLGRDPDQCADLSRRCRSPETWWVAPEDGEVSALLLAAEPVDAFARLIARYVKVARISPYQTSLGVRKESGFFGRTRILSDILNRGELANYLVVGGRQLGKSSLLLALQRRFTGIEGIDCRYLSVGQAGIESRLAAARHPAGAAAGRGGHLRGRGRRSRLCLSQRLPLTERRGPLSLHPGRVLEPVPLRRFRLSVADQELCRHHPDRRAGAGGVPGARDQSDGGPGPDLCRRGDGRADTHAHRRAGQPDRHPLRPDAPGARAHRAGPDRGGPGSSACERVGAQRAGGLGRAGWEAAGGEFSGRPARPGDRLRPDRT